ncbi:hypothetical protein N7447_005913 [Penicillium robsamsonii]|uniref:uncharacterized protein n=1 Tax=Penicillium robsamsonii TaxID=1792511 RepID=UPI002546F4D1|nr:uncharacterized protein N7447_005913 [Penicillium robsamsonii]KAJ5823573.1 hypothetical protein N7447_005913 [Penicillium robsamsonii]
MRVDYQHTLCYGYYSVKDNQIPYIHYCYSCLIGYDFDSNLMEELIKRTRTRRIIDDEARAIINTLRKLGILESTLSKGRKYLHRIGFPRFSEGQSHPCNTIYSEILAPMLLIRSTGIHELITEKYEKPPPNPIKVTRSHWSRSGIPILGRFTSESAEKTDTIDHRSQPKLWKRVRSNPSASGYFFEGQTSNSVSKRLLDSSDEGFEDDASTREAKTTKLR